MTKQIKRWLWIAAGWFFIVLGIVGLFLPILQGILFLFIGLLILSSEYVWAHRLLQKLRSKVPKISARLDSMHQQFIARWGHRPETDI